MLAALNLGSSLLNIQIDGIEIQSTLHDNNKRSDKNV